MLHHIDRAVAGAAGGGGAVDVIETWSGAYSTDIGDGVRLPDTANNGNPWMMAEANSATGKYGLVGDGSMGKAGSVFETSSLYLDFLQSDVDLAATWMIPSDGVGSYTTSCIFACASGTEWIIPDVSPWYTAQLVPKNCVAVGRGGNVMRVSLFQVVNGVITQFNEVSDAVATTPKNGTLFDTRLVVSGGQVTGYYNGYNLGTYTYDASLVGTNLGLNCNGNTYSHSHIYCVERSTHVAALAL